MLAFAHAELLVVGAVVLAIAVASAARVQRTPSFDELRVFAAEQGWQFRPSMLAHRDSPLLRQGDDQEAGPVLAVRIGGLEAELYEHREIRVHDSTRVCAATLVVLRVADGLHLPGIDELRLIPRGEATAVGARLNDRRVVSLESVELENAFLLEAGNGTTDLAVRRLFTPGLITALLDLAAADCYLGEYLDFHLGRLVLASGGTITPSDGPALVETLRQATPVVEHFAGLAEQLPRA